MSNADHKKGGHGATADRLLSENHKISGHGDTNGHGNECPCLLCVFVAKGPRSAKLILRDNIKSLGKARHTFDSSSPGQVWPGQLGPALRSCGTGEHTTPLTHRQAGFSKNEIQRFCKPSCRT